MGERGPVIRWLGSMPSPADLQKLSMEERVSRLEHEPRRKSQARHWLVPWVPVIVALVGGWFALEQTRQTVKNQAAETIRQTSLDEDQRRAQVIANRMLKAYEERTDRQLKRSRLEQAQTEPPDMHFQRVTITSQNHNNAAQHQGSDQRERREQ